MDAIVRWNNNQVNDMNGLIDDLDKAMQTKSSQIKFG